MKLIDGPITSKVTAGLALTGLALFSSSFCHPFHFDDTLIVNDSNVTNAARWAHFLNPVHLRQLTFFTFYLNHLVGGIHPAGYHVVNVAIHITNAILLFLLLSRFTDKWVATVAAAIFMVHPIQTAAVLYVYERSTLLACFFSLLALLALADGRTGLAILLFVLAFEGKESAIGVPLAVAALYGGKVFSKARLIIFAGALALAITALASLAYWNEQTVGIHATAQVSPVRYLLTETRVVYTYMRLLLLPYSQALEYDVHEPGGIINIAGIALILAAGYLLSRNERWRIPGLCMLAFFVLLLPTSSVVPSVDAAFEHRLYLPMLAFSLFAASLLSRVPRRSVVTTVIIAVLVVLTVRRESVWASDVRLWEDTATKAPGKARVWFNLGGAYINTDPEKARVALQRALDLQPHFAAAWYDLGIIEQQKKNWDAALADYGTAVNQQPDYWPAWNNMANTLSALGQQERALTYLRQTLDLNPNYWPAHYNSAVIYFMRGRYIDAIRQLRIVLDWQPDFREAHFLLATSLSRAGYRTASDEELKKLGEQYATASEPVPSMMLAPSRP
jgi:tetratricopeptide (TPR) repeat protein